MCALYLLRKQFVVFQDVVCIVALLSSDILSPSPQVSCPTQMCQCTLEPSVASTISSVTSMMYVRQFNSSVILVKQTLSINNVTSVSIQ